MSKESRVDANHHRVTSDNGRHSTLYEVDGCGNQRAVEHADHHPDGTTKAYEPGSCLTALITGEYRGRSK